MGYERKKLKFEVLLETYFTNFPKLLLANLIFAVPSLLLMTAFYFLSQALFQSVNIAFFLLSILFIYPFYAGVVKVVRNIVRGDTTFNVFQVYLSGVKENFPAFLLHGVIITAASVISFLSLNLYIGLMSQSWIFGTLLFFCIIVVLFLFFISFYLPLMSVTFDLPLRYVYKNSFLMAYGEIKNNFFAFLGEAVLIGIALTVMLVSGNTLVLLILIAALWALVFPVTYTFINVFFIYNDMYHMASGEGKREYDKEKKSAGDKPEKNAPVIDDADFSSIDIASLKDTDDYIFFNGKMVKQSALLKMVREKEQSEQEVKDHES